MKRTPVCFIRLSAAVILISAVLLTETGCGPDVSSGSSRNETSLEKQETEENRLPIPSGSDPFTVEYIDVESPDSDSESPAAEASDMVFSETNAFTESYNHYLYAKEASLTDVVSTGSKHFLISKANNNADRRITEGIYTEKPMQISENAYRDFLSVPDGIRVDYTYSDYYRIGEAQKEARKYDKERRHQPDSYTDLICPTDDVPSVGLLTQVIEANSRDFLDAHPGYLELDASERKTIIRIIHEMLEYNEALFSEEDRKRIYCLLKDISIVGIDSYDFSVNDLRKPYNARVMEDGTIIIDLETIKSYLTDEEAREKTYEHEIYHLFQRMCPDAQIDGYTQIGPSQYFDALEVNSLHWNWLYEAAAEKKVMNHYHAEKPLVYNNMIGYLKSLDLITLLRPEYESTAVEDSTLTVDENKMFELLGAETEEEQKEIIELLYSIDYLQNNREDFDTVYPDEDGFRDENERSEIKQEMKNSICLSFAEIFYRNLAERILNAEVSEQDVFYLINAFEEDISWHTCYDEQPETYSAFISEYVKIQDAFFRMLADSSDAEYERLVSAFGTYSMVIRTPDGYERNCVLKWLTDAEKEFIFEEMVTGNIDYMTVNIRDCVQ